MNKNWNSFLAVSVLRAIVFCCFYYLSQLHAGPELSQEDYEKNRVVIRIWHFTGIRADQGDSVGHVSVQIPAFEEKDGGYASFWPAQRFHLLQRVGGSFNSLKGDYHSEERIPDSIFCLYTLNVAEIRKRFLAFKEQVKKDPTGNQTGWSLCGDCYLVSKGSQQHSCASLALTLLKSGDLRDLFLSSVIPMKQKVSYSLQFPADKTVKTNPLVVSPNDVAEIVLKARQLERSNFPTIAKISLYENSVDLTQIPPFNNQHQEMESPLGNISPGGIWSMIWRALGNE